MSEDTRQPGPKYRPISPDNGRNQCPVCGYVHPAASIVTDHRRKEHDHD